MLFNPFYVRRGVSPDQLSTPTMERPAPGGGRATTESVAAARGASTRPLHFIYEHGHLARSLDAAVRTVTTTPWLLRRDQPLPQRRKPIIPRVNSG